MYGVMVKIDKTLPWIELERTCETHREAKKAAEDFIKSLQLKIIALPEKKPMKALVTVKR